uniref:Uncharacterized protein n=1 Tax=Arundo donax TaxID=35708 RepID=A0A0A9GN72_ARUDO
MRSVLSYSSASLASVVWIYILSMSSRKFSYSLGRHYYLSIFQFIS